MAIILPRKGIPFLHYLKEFGDVSKWWHLLSKDGLGGQEGNESTGDGLSVVTPVMSGQHCLKYLELHIILLSEIFGVRHRTTVAHIETCGPVILYF